MKILPTSIMLSPDDEKISFTMSFSGPFEFVKDALKLAEPVIKSWISKLPQDDLLKEIDVKVEFDYGDFVYHNKHYLFNDNRGGAESTIFWIDADIHDWLHRKLPRLVKARNMINECLH
ncbi:MAG: hypothetical protein SNJ70_02350 [Armatimonadota bacterium]